MNKGWPGESRRHAMAARGIPCRANAVFRPYRPTGPIDYTHGDEEWVMAFWKASIEDDWDEFNFEKVFALARQYMDMWRQHEIESIMDDNIERAYIYASDKAVDGVLPGVGPIDIIFPVDDMYYDEDTESLQMAVAEMMVEEEEGLGRKPRGWTKLREELNNPPKDIQGKIMLIDSIIHTQHWGGSLLKDKDWEDLEIGPLRQKFEKTYGRYLDA